MSDVLRVLIADDEEIARRRLARLLAMIPETAVAGECADAGAVLERVREGGVDVLLLDIQMPGLTGLDAVALLPHGGPQVIFCTAHAEHAVGAFDAGAVDYLQKPVDAARLQKALERARARRPPSLNRLAISTRQGIVLLDPAEISHAMLEGELVAVVTASATYLTDSTLQALEEKLGGFERVHRRALLNLEHVVRLEPNESGGFLARTRAGHGVEVSRAAARELRRRLGL